MEDLIHIQKTFEKKFYRQKKVSNQVKIASLKCDLSNSDFSNNTFMDCEFIDVIFQWLV
jgi:hypothetical protein